MSSVGKEGAAAEVDPEVVDFCVWLVNRWQDSPQTSRTSAWDLS
jgi:hypothetical protein